VLPDGGYLLAGTSESFTEDGFDVYLSRTYPNGFPLWSQLFGGSNHDYGYCVKLTSDGGYIIGGKTKSYGNGLHDVYIVKTQPDLGVTEHRKSTPSRPKLRIYPNPFSEKASIELGIEDGRLKMEDFSLQIFDVSGRMVREIVLPNDCSLLPTGITWDGRDRNGCVAPSGVYYVKLKTHDCSLTRKILKIR
jgi:hypothetical protein